MATPQLLNDIISVLLLLAPSAALLSLVIAGVSLRREGTMTFAIGGGFTKWMFWAIVFLTLQPLLSWFTSFGVPVPLPNGGIATGWLANLQSDVAQFVTNFVVQRLVPTLAAFFVLRAILDAASGQHPLPSILAAMFLLGTQTTYNLIQSYNTGTQYATVDVLGQSLESPGRDGHADRCRSGAGGSDLELRNQKTIPAAGCGGASPAHSLSHLETADFDDVGERMNLGNMSFDHGILHLANWLGNVIMPTLAAAFIIIAILQFSKGQEFSHSMYGALACLLVSGLTRAFETFASQAAWNNPDLYWISITTLIDWVANVILPVYAASQVAAMALRLGIFSLVHPTSGWLRHFVTAALCLMVSGLLRLAEFFVAHGTGGVT